MATTGYGVNDLNLYGGSYDYEPTRQYNWVLEIEGIDPLSIKSVSEFGEKNSEHEVHHGNEKVYVAGKPEWEGGEMTIYDSISGKSFDALREWRLKVYDPKSGKIGLSTQYKKIGTLIQMRPDGTEVRRFSVKGVWPTSFKYGATDYSANELRTISSTLRYDKAVIE